MATMLAIHQGIPPQSKKELLEFTIFFVDAEECRTVQLPPLSLFYNVLDCPTFVSGSHAEMLFAEYLLQFGITELEKEANSSGGSLKEKPETLRSWRDPDTRTCRFDEDSMPDYDWKEACVRASAENKKRREVLSQRKEYWRRACLARKRRLF